MSDPQIFDIIVLVLVGWLMIRGAMRGMVAQIISLCSVFVCWFVATKFGPVITPSIPAKAPLNSVLAMLLLFVGTSIVIWSFHGLIAKLIASVKLKNFDREMGAVLGGLKGVLLCMVITFFAVTLNDRAKTAVLNSYSGKYFVAGIEKTASIIPEDASVLLRKNLDGFRERINGAEELDPIRNPLEQLAGDNPISGGKIKEEIKEDLNKVKGFISKVIPLSAVKEPSKPVSSSAQNKIGSSAPAPVSTQSSEANALPKPLEPIQPFQPSGNSTSPPVIPK